ncbi:hypothetical protein Lfu02_64110 [Longispora fulva]|nr:hypothetical protein Lfu02_64110 [Longispora fulva]
MDDGIGTVDRVVAAIRAQYEVFSAGRTPHPEAAAARLPDGTVAPEVLRAWAAFDNAYPWYLSSRRSPVPVIGADRVLNVAPMADVWRHVCHDSVADELEDDPETLDWLLELAGELTDRYGGYGIVLEPDDDTVCRILWIAPDRTARILWYEDNEVEQTEPFQDWLAGLFEDE